MIAVDLHLRGPFHVGELGVGREETLSYVPSDTLYAALVSAWVAGGDKGPFDPPPLRLTSAFPRIGSLRLYPHPFVRINVTQAQQDALGKTLTKFEWCSERIFNLLINGADVNAQASKSNFADKIWFHPDDKPSVVAPFWETKPPVPHVAIDRLSNAPNLFHNGRATFGPDCGLWFGVEYDAPDSPARLERALGYLADAGLGGLRSTGHGGFSFDIQQNVTLADRTPSGYAVTLSRYLPASPAELSVTLKAPSAAYKLVHVGGWCQDDAGHPWRRRQVRLAREGSVIGWTGEQVGYIADLKPQAGQFGDRPVLRYGLAFPIPVVEEALL